jgi:hypothetical protein
MRRDHPTAGGGTRVIVLACLSSFLARKSRKALTQINVHDARSA